VLLDPYCCPVNITPNDFGHSAVAEAKTLEEIALQRKSVDMAMAVVDRVRSAVQSIAEEMVGGGGPVAGEARQLAAFCPLALDAVYWVMALYFWLCQEGGGE